MIAFPKLNQPSTINIMSCWSFTVHHYISTIFACSRSPSLRSRVLPHWLAQYQILIHYGWQCFTQQLCRNYHFVSRRRGSRPSSNGFIWASNYTVLLAICTVSYLARCKTRLIKRDEKTINVYGEWFTFYWQMVAECMRWKWKWKECKGGWWCGSKERTKHKYNLNLLTIIINCNLSREWVKYISHSMKLIGLYNEHLSVYRSFFLFSVLLLPLNCSSVFLWSDAFLFCNEIWSIFLRFFLLLSREWVVKCTLYSSGDISELNRDSEMRNWIKAQC